MCKFLKILQSSSFQNAPDLDAFLGAFSQRFNLKLIYSFSQRIEEETLLTYLWSNMSLIIWFSSFWKHEKSKKKIIVEKNLVMSHNSMTLIGF